MSAVILWDHDHRQVAPPAVHRETRRQRPHLVRTHSCSTPVCARVGARVCVLTIPLLSSVTAPPVHCLLSGRPPQLITRPRTL